MTTRRSLLGGAASLAAGLALGRLGGEPTPTPPPASSPVCTPSGVQLARGGIAWGDSILAGTGLAPQSSWLDWLNRDLRAIGSATIVNAAISGWTVEAGLQTIRDRAAQGDPPPTYTLVALGTNNLPGWAPSSVNPPPAWSLEHYFYMLADIDKVLATWGVPTANRRYATILPMCPGTIRPAGGIVEELTRRKQIWNSWLRSSYAGRVLDLDGALKEDGNGYARPDYIDRDGLHPNESGHVTIARYIDPIPWRS